MAKKYGDQFKILVTALPPLTQPFFCSFLFFSNPALTLTSHLGQHEKNSLRLERKRPKQARTIRDVKYM